MTFTQRLQVFPPILVRLLARHKGGHPLNLSEIVERSGKMPDVCHLLSRFEVFTISKQTHWKEVGVYETLSFMRGCGFSTNRDFRRVEDYLSKQPTFQYLRKSPEWKDYYQPLLIRWRNAYPINVFQSDMPHANIRKLLNRLTPLYQLYDPN